MHNGENSFFRAICSKFVTLPGEELILVQRKHPLVFILPVSVALIFGIISLIGSVLLFPFASRYLYLLISGILVVLIFISSTIIKSIVDWYFNFYIATNRRIIEVSYKPLSSREINEVLLDQVKCTEIDSKVEGVINEFLDIGDVIVTFDRPTHQEEFVFASVSDPKGIETDLENAFSNNTAFENNHASPKDGDGDSGWFVKGKTDPKKWRYTERISPVNIRRGGDTLWNTQT